MQANSFTDAEADADFGAGETLDREFQGQGVSGTDEVTTIRNTAQRRMDE